MNSTPIRASKKGSIPRVISGVGILLLLVFVGEWLVFAGIHVNGVVSGSFLVSLFLSLLFTGGLLYGGYWLERSDLPPERYPRIAKWFVGGMACYLGVNVPMMIVWPPGSLQLLIGWMRFAVTVGGVAGLLVGIAEARAIQRERAAERAAVRAEEAELHHQDLTYLNSLLRHEVLNTANVITGYASLLLENDDVEDGARDRVRTIHRHGRAMTNVIQDVQVLIAATHGDAELARKNLSDALAVELDTLRDTVESVEVETSVPDDVYVVADDLLPRVFSNLLMNAVEHNDGDTPRVTVTVEESADTATVRIADDGPGIPVDELPTLFERGDNTGATHGLGLYLVRTLVERYDGTIELVDTGDDGSEFAVTLPTATRDTDESASLTGDDRPTPNAEPAPVQYD